MSKIMQEPPLEAARTHFSQLCVLLTGMASGAVQPPTEDLLESSASLMGRRDGYHVVVAHLAASRTLREAADKCVAFGRGVRERAEAHPYGADWSTGFAQATLEAAADLAMYAATGTLPAIDSVRLRAARVAVRNVIPLAGYQWPQRPAHDTPTSHHEW